MAETAFVQSNPSISRSRYLRSAAGAVFGFGAGFFSLQTVQDFLRNAPVVDKTTDIIFASVFSVFLTVNLLRKNRATAAVDMETPAAN